jgi:hypothetical protein
VRLLRASAVLVGRLFDLATGSGGIDIDIKIKYQYQGRAAKNF